MSGLSELNSFVGKFVSLWKAGLDANLLVTTHAGEAKLTLEVGLGRAPDQVPPSPYAGKMDLLDNVVKQDVQNRPD